VLGVKGLLRRANLIPNAWKLRIGATHELYTRKVDNNVQIQGLPGRMTGYWRAELDAGHKTGPHRTSIKAIKEYEEVYKDPYGINSYTTAGFTKKKGKVHADSTFLTHVDGLVLVPLPVVKEDKDHRVFDTQEEAIVFLSKPPFGKTLSKRPYDIAPVELREGDKNPTVEYLMKRMWGINAESHFRMCPIEEKSHTGKHKWCVYWRPSMFPT
jgi:hypothetical protein